MSHRIKNLLAIATGLTRLTSRSSTPIEDMARQLASRLTALGRAHDLVRPLPSGQGSTALLGDIFIFAVLRAPHDDQGAFAGQMVALPRIGVGRASATALALIVHELATNSVKYGALSAGDGVLDVSGIMVDEYVEIRWTEQGGPETPAPSELTGYGSNLVRRTIEDQLSGSVTCNWANSGAVVTLRIDGEKMSL